MSRNSTFVIVGTATLDQVNSLVKQGISRDKAKMYSTEQAARRLRDLAKKRENGGSLRKKPQEKRESKSKLLVKEIWPRITSLVEAHATKSWIAVAFFGTEAAKQLPLKNGSTLVVNLAEKTLKAGLTNPFELEKLVNRGVEVYGNDWLHAKIFVFPSCAIVGSNNASRTSAKHWVEASIEVSDQGTVTACKRFVKSLCQSTAIGPEYLEHLKSLYHPPSPDLPKKNQPKELWFVRVAHIEYDQHDEAAESRGMPHAEEELTEGRYVVDHFCTSGSSFVRKVALHDSVAQIVSGEGELVVNPTSRVLHFERYTKDDGSEWMMVFVEASEDMEPKNLDTVIFELTKKRCPSSMTLRTIRNSKKITD